MLVIQELCVINASVILEDAAVEETSIGIRIVVMGTEQISYNLHIRFTWFFVTPLPLHQEDL